MIDGEVLLAIQVYAGGEVNTLIDGRYEDVEVSTKGRHLTASDLREGVASLGSHLAVGPREEWENLEVRFCSVDKGYDLVWPLWTEEGPSGWGLDMHLVPESVMYSDSPIHFQVEVNGLAPVEIPDPFEFVLTRFGSRKIWRPKHKVHKIVAPRTDAKSPKEGDDLRSFAPVPEQWRPVLTEIVGRLVEGDYAGLAADGLISYTSDPSDVSIGVWIEDYPGTLVDLPDEAWDYSDYAPQEGERRCWWVVVPLWTAEEGHSDLSLEARIWERRRGKQIIVKVDNVHVM